MKTITDIHISRAFDNEGKFTGVFGVSLSFEVPTAEAAIAEVTTLMGRGFTVAPAAAVALAAPVVAPPVAAPTVPPPVKANRVEPEPPAEPPAAPTAPAAEAPVRRGPGRPPKVAAAPAAPPAAKPAPAPEPKDANDDLDSLDGDDEPTSAVASKNTSEDDKLVADAAGLGKIREVVELVIKRKGFTKAEQVGAWVKQHGSRIEAVARLGDKGAERAQTAADMMLPDADE